MKSLIVTFLFIAVSLLADANTDWVDAQVKAIKPSRVGVSSSAVNGTRNPFLFQYSSTSNATQKGTSNATSSNKSMPTVQRPLQLFAVMNNSALISGNWYKSSETVHGYTVTDIQPDSVLLKKGSSHKKLFINSENKNIKIQVK
jgi:hypothetical protein